MAFKATRNTPFSLLLQKRVVVYVKNCGTVKTVLKNAINSAIQVKRDDRAVCPINRSPHAAAAGLLLWARRAGDVISPVRLRLENSNFVHGLAM